MRKKIALVLSGGGFKGAFQVGALKYLRDNWHRINPDAPAMKFDIIAGVSVGTLNGYLVAANQFEVLEELWKKIGENGVGEIYSSNYIDTAAQSNKPKIKINLNAIVKKTMPNLFSGISFFDGFGALFSPKKFAEDLLSKAEKELASNLKSFKSIADNSPLRLKLQALVRKDAIRDVVFKCGFVSLDNGQYYALKHSDFTTDQDLQNAILASTSIPIVWEPIPVIDTINSQILNSVDGGIRNVSPLGDVIDEINNDPSDAEYTIIIINCNTGIVQNNSFENANVVEIALRSLTDITLAEVFNNDLKEFIKINDFLEQASVLHPGIQIMGYNFDAKTRTETPLRKFKSIIIQPAPDILGDTLTANKELIEKRIMHGLQKAEQALLEH